MMRDSSPVYVCTLHLIPQATPASCPFCGRVMIECQPGEDGSPSRRPVVDERGRVRSQAPLWWLERTVEDLWPYLEPEGRR